MFVMCSVFGISYGWHNNMHAGLLYFVFLILLTVQPIAIAMHIRTGWVFRKIEMSVVEQRRNWICWYGWNFIIIIYKAWTIIWIVSYRMCCCCYYWTRNPASKCSYAFFVLISILWCCYCRCSLMMLFSLVFFLLSVLFFISRCRSTRGKYIQIWLKCGFANRYNIEEFGCYAWHFGSMVLNLFALVMCPIHPFERFEWCVTGVHETMMTMAMAMVWCANFIYTFLSPTELLIHFALLMCIFTRSPFHTLTPSSVVGRPRSSR